LQVEIRIDDGRYVISYDDVAEIIIRRRSHYHSRLYLTETITDSDLKSEEE